MRKYILMSFVLLFSLSDLYSEELARRGMLGVHLAPDTTGEASAIIMKVIPNSTASNIGIIENDKIYSVNNTEVKDFTELMISLNSSKKEQTIRLGIIREGESINLSGDLLPSPFVTKNQYELNSFNYKGNKIRTIIEKPEGKGPFPAIYYIQGYPCQSCEFADQTSPIRKFIDDLVNMGYLVYRVEKPGMGDSKGELRCDEIDFTTENEVFDKGYSELLKSKYIDKNKISIFGHSLGGMHAPIISSKHKPASTIVYGIRVDDWYDYMLKTFDVQYPLWEGGDFVQGELYKNLVRDYLYQIYFKNATPEELIDSDSTKNLFAVHLNYSGSNQFFGRDYKFFVDLNATNIVKYWSEVKNPVLSLHGEYDLQALDNEGAKKVEQIVDFYNDTLMADFIEIPKTEHLFLRVESQKHIASIMQNKKLFEYAPNNYNSEVAKIVDNWLKKVYARKD